MTKFLKETILSHLHIRQVGAVKSGQAPQFWAMLLSRPDVVCGKYRTLIEFVGVFLPLSAALGVLCLELLPPARPCLEAGSHYGRKTAEEGHQAPALARDLTDILIIMSCQVLSIPSASTYFHF